MKMTVTFNFSSLYHPALARVSSAEIPSGLWIPSPMHTFTDGGRMPRKQEWRGVRIYTIGHSTRPMSELVALLRAFGVTVLVDVRTLPRSRHNPQFDQRALRASLRHHRLGYVHLPSLGGLRRPRPDSPNLGWHNSGFRGYADYILTHDFEEGLAELRAQVDAGEVVALMCAEAVPWRCHRTVLSDALVARGADVEHIMGLGRASPHHLTRFAHVRGARVTYPTDETVQ
jgi:uncharacterized protein (DUF488 family)